MEIAGYRETIEMLTELFPGRIAISVKETAKVLDMSPKTVYNLLDRMRNPIPSTRITPKKRVVPLAQLAKWIAASSAKGYRY